MCLHTKPSPLAVTMMTARAWPAGSPPRSVTTITLACYLTAIAVGIHTLNTPLVGLGVV